VRKFERPHGPSKSKTTSNIWVTPEDSCVDVDHRLGGCVFYPVLDAMDQALRARDALERRGDRVVECEAKVDT